MALVPTELSALGGVLRRHPDRDRTDTTTGFGRVNRLCHPHARASGAPSAPPDRGRLRPAPSLPNLLQPIPVGALAGARPSSPTATQLATARTRLRCGRAPDFRCAIAGWAAAERRGELSKERETRRLLTNRPCSRFAKESIPKNVYASAIGLCKDSIIMQSRKLSNSDFWRSFNM